MLKYIIDFIKEKNKSIAYWVIFGVIVCYMMVKEWRFVEETYHTVYSLFVILIQHIPSLSFIVMIFIGVKFSLNYSDKKSMEHVNDYYKKGFVVKSMNNRYLGIELRENHEYIDGQYGRTLQVVIKNITDLTIDYIRGTVFLYNSSKERIKSIEFETKNLRKSYSDNIFYNLLDSKKMIWSEFDVYIEEYKAGDDIKRDFYIEGRTIIRMFSIALNYFQFYDYKIFGIRTKYNLVWLKNLVKHKLIPAIRFFYSQKVFYNYKRPVYLELIALVVRLMQFLLVAFVFIVILSIIFIALLDIGKIFISAFDILKIYFQHIVKFF